jgi:ParB family transcriptional regulator, chromosome partitioning protein
MRAVLSAPVLAGEGGSVKNQQYKDKKLMQSVVSINDRHADSEESQTVMLDIGRLLPNPLNPRGEVEDDDVLELMRSIKEHGILQALLVTPYRDGYYIVAGHRRRRAGYLAGLTKLPCVIRNFTEDEQQEVMLIENIQRKNLTPIQEARGFQRMLVAGRSVIEIVERLGLSSGYINARIDILRLEKSVQHLFEMNLLQVGAASILALSADSGKQKHYATIAIQQHLPLAKLEALIRGAEMKPKKAPGRAKGKQKRKRVLREYEVFTRSEAIQELSREGSVPFAVIADAFNDICDGVCVEEDGNKEICEACPGPRLIASLLRRTGVEIKGQVAE